MQVSLKAYCRGSKPGAVHMWDAGTGEDVEPWQVERLVHDATKLAEEELKTGFKPPILVLIQEVQPVSQPTPEPEPIKA